MSSKRANISQIRKYLAGELDAHAMHQLEREAQDDPFLMDALEGYSLQKKDQQGQLNELECQLQQRTGKGRVSRLPSGWIMAAAASVLVVLTVAYLLWPAAQQTPVKPVALVLPQSTPPPAQPDTLVPPPAAEHLAVHTPPQPATVKAGSQISPAAPAASIMAVAATPTVAITGNQPDSNASYHATAAITKPIDSLPAATLLAARKMNVLANEGPPAAEPAKTRIAALLAKTITRISGIVSDQTGRPLSGAAVSGKSENGSAKTDNKGRFSIPGRDGDLLTINAPGYESKTVKGAVNDSLNVILRSTSQSLNELVAIDFGRSPAVTVKAAHPQMGWDNYNKYLKSHAVTNGKEGTVRLSFMVDSQGRLSNFKIDKGLSDEADKLAVGLVTDGPPWAPNADGKPKTIHLKIAFSVQP